MANQKVSELNEITSFQAGDLLYVARPGDSTEHKLAITDLITAAEATIESIIDTLANLTSIQGRTVTLADAGVNAFFGWDDTAGAYENLTASEALEILKTVDGAGSGLDADLLDGQSSAFYATASSVSDHLSDTTDAHDASAISFVAGGNLAATDVQAAIEELDDEKQPLDADLTAIAALSTTAAGRSVLTVADPNADRLVGWDDSDGALEILALTDITTEASPADGDFVIIYGAEGDLRKVDWSDLPGAGGGVNGPVSSTDNAIVRWDGVGGDTVQDSGITIDDSDNVAGAGINLNANTLTGTLSEFNTALSDADFATLAGTETLSNKTLTLPQINDTSADHQYVFAVSELSADRTVTLPLLTGNDTFVFNDFAATLQNKTIDLTVNTLTGSVAEFNTALESADFYTTGGTDVALADGGTGASLSDPGADRLFFWDESANATAFLTPGNGLTITTTTIAVDSASQSVDGIVELATAAEYRTGTDTARVPAIDQIWAAAQEVTLTDAATIAVDLATGINFVVTLTDNRTLGNPTNEKVGQMGYIRIVQDAGGTNTLSFGTDWEFAGGSAPSISTGANDQNILFYYVVATNRVVGTLLADIA